MTTIVFDTETATLEELQVAWRRANDEIARRFEERRSTCDHVDTPRGMIEVPRPSNLAPGCIYCLSELPTNE